MDRIFVPSVDLTDWRRFLADPARHWKRGKSALESAVAWETARRSDRGLPETIARVLDSHPRTAESTLLLAIPELQVDLPGGGHPSQTDVWSLLRTDDGLISLSVEAKSGEPLDRLVGEWLADATSGSGKPERLHCLRECLGLGAIDLSRLRYQLLHRAASALIMGQRFHATSAVLLVHSFGGHLDDKSREDYHRFAEAMGCPPAFDSLVMTGRATTPPLLIGWLTDTPASTEAATRALQRGSASNRTLTFARSAPHHGRRGDMNPTRHRQPWQWRDGAVHPGDEHFELRYGSAEKSGWDDWLPVALVGRPTENVFPVRFLVDRSDPTHAQAVHEVTRELDFYLVEKGERDPWTYARHHCGTSANAYSTVHWSFFLATRQDV